MNILFFFLCLWGRRNGVILFYTKTFVSGGAANKKILSISNLLTIKYYHDVYLFDLMQFNSHFSKQQIVNTYFIQAVQTFFGLSQIQHAFPTRPIKRQQHFTASFHHPFLVLYFHPDVFLTFLEEHVLLLSS